MTKIGEIQTRVRLAHDDPETSLAELIQIAESVRVLEGNEFPPYFRTLKAAFLGSYTIQGLAEAVVARSIFHNVRLETYTAPYNQFTQEVLAAESNLYAFAPNLIFLLIDAREVVDFQHVASILDMLLERTKSHIIISNFLGGDTSQDLNGNLQKFEGKNRVHIFDLARFLEEIGKEKYWYTKYMQLGDFRIAPAGFLPLSEELAKYIVARSGATKKCLVVDLDNTLWKGIVGEDGVDGVIPYKKLQMHILGLYERGIILAMNSKNNPEDVFEVFEKHKDMLLKKNHFVAWRINWESKDKNIAELAEELNLGTDSFVFADDDLFQREVVSGAFPEIAVLAPEALTQYAGFHAFLITEEDKRRGVMYAEERQRGELKKSLRTEEDFLRELAMQIDIRDVSEDNITRVSQLTQKTNQFNLTTRRYSEEEVRERIQKGWKICTVSVTDRFGDYGIVGVVMIESKNNEWRIDNFLLSCRILGRRVEDRIVQDIKQKAKNMGMHLIRAEYIPTAKNRQTEKFFDEEGFLLRNEFSHGMTRRDLLDTTVTYERKMYYFAL